MKMDFTKYVKDGHTLILGSDVINGINGDITPIDISKLISFLQYNKDITELVLHDCLIDAEGVHNLVNSPHLENLKSLDLSNNPINLIGREVAVSIATSQHLQNLENLTLCGNLIDSADAWVIADSPNLENLKSLDLSNNLIGDEGTKHIATSPYLKNLKSLGLRFNKIGDVGAEFIANSSCLKNLESLDLYFNEIDDKGAKALESGKHPHLKLDLSFNYICDESIGALRKIERLLEYAFKSERSTLKDIYSSRFNELRYSMHYSQASLADVLKPDEQIIYCSDEQGSLSSMLEKIDSYNKSKICIASIDVGPQMRSGHCIAFYLFPEQKKMLLIDPDGSTRIPQQIKPFLENKSYTLYTSSTKIQDDGYSCVLITSEIVRMLSSHHKAVEKYLSTQDSNRKPFDLYNFLPKEELDQLRKSFSEEINIDCSRVKGAKGADYRAAHFMCSLIPGKGHQRHKRMVEEIRSFFIGNQDNTKLFHQKINELFQQSETASNNVNQQQTKATHGNSTYNTKEVDNAQNAAVIITSSNTPITNNKAPEKKSMSFYSEYKRKITLSIAGLSIAGAVAAYMLAYPIIAMALAVSAVIILMVSGIVKIREKSEDPGTEKSSASVFNHVEGKQAEAAHY